MAKATKGFARPVEPVVEFTLVLSEEEARALQAVFACVGGSPDRSRRGLIQNVYYALSAAGAGIGYSASIGRDPDVHANSTITFDDRSRT
jgi:hypothetical protein